MLLIVGLTMALCALIELTESVLCNEMMCLMSNWWWW